jgi:hypothetical protein
MNKKFYLSSIFSIDDESFEGKRDDEHVLLILRRHWFTLLGTFLFLIVGFFIPFIIVGAFGSFLLKYSLLTLSLFIIFLYYMFLWFMFSYQLMLYVLDIWVLTDCRLIDMAQNGIFNRIVSEVDLDKIEDVTVKITGAIPTFLNYGQISLQSAGTVDHFDFPDATNPERVREMITQAIKENKDKSFHSQASEIIENVEMARAGLLNPDHNTNS